MAGPQKVKSLEEDFIPLEDDFIPDEAPPSDSLWDTIKSGWNAVNTEIEPLKRFAKSVGDFLDPPSARTSGEEFGSMKFGEDLPYDVLSSFFAGATEGQIPTTPLNVGLTVGAGPAMKTGGKILGKIPGATKLLEFPLTRPGQNLAKVIEEIKTPVAEPVLPKRQKYKTVNQSGVFEKVEDPKWQEILEEPVKEFNANIKAEVDKKLDFKPTTPEQVRDAQAFLDKESGGTIGADSPIPELTPEVDEIAKRLTLTNAQRKKRVIEILREHPEWGKGPDATVRAQAQARLENQAVLEEMDRARNQSKVLPIEPELNRRTNDKITGSMKDLTDDELKFLDTLPEEQITPEEFNKRYAAFKGETPTVQPIDAKTQAELDATDAGFFKELMQGEQGAVPLGRFAPIAQKMKPADWLGVPRALLTTPDLSAPFNQGFGAIGYKAWWTSWDDMVRAAGSENAYNAIMAEIAQRPNFSAPQGNLFGLGGMQQKSLAEEAGLSLTDIASFTKREEQFASSQLLEAIPGYGRLVRGSNRGYTAFLNKTRADMFDSLILNAQKAGLDPTQDLRLARNIAEFINNATGRGSLGRLEKVAPELNALFFAPRKVSGIVRMMNPKQYLNILSGDASKRMVAKQYWRSFFGMSGFGLSMLGAAKAAGADVVMDPRSADFGKIKIGDTRLDQWGGFQQYLTLAARLASNSTVSSTNPDKGPATLGQGVTPTRGGLFLNNRNSQQYGRGFVGNKLNPIVGFVQDWMTATPNKPFDVPKALQDTLVPIIAQDVIDAISDNPSWAQMLAIPPSVFGMGSQTYGRKQ